MDGSSGPFAWFSCMFLSVIHRVGSNGYFICVGGWLHFRKQNQVNVKLQPSINGLKPFAQINVPICVNEAPHAQIQ